MSWKGQHRQAVEEKSRYALAAGVMAHGELVIGLKLKLTLDGRRRKWAFYSQFRHAGVQHHGLFSNKSDFSVDDLESTGK